MFRWRAGGRRPIVSPQPPLCQRRMANLQDLQLSGIFINLCAECKHVFLTVLTRRPVQLGACWKAPSKAAPRGVRVFRPLICKLADGCIVCVAVQSRVMIE